MAIKSSGVRYDQVRDYAARIADLQDKKDLLVKQMVELSQGRKEYLILRSISSIGDSTACRLIGVGDIRRFQNAKKLNAYVGIYIMLYQSGNTQYQDRINKSETENKHSRKILYFMVCAMLMVRGKLNHIVDYYYKLKSSTNHGLDLYY